jgi:hypothetical protein
MQFKPLIPILTIACTLLGLDIDSGYINKAEIIRELILKRDYNELYKNRATWINKKHSKINFIKEMEIKIGDTTQLKSLNLIKYDKILKASALEFYYNDSLNNKYYTITIDKLGNKYEFIKFETIEFNNK